MVCAERWEWLWNKKRGKEGEEGRVGKKRKVSDYIMGTSDLKRCFDMI